MKPHEVFETLDRIVRAEAEIYRQSNQPISRMNMTAQSNALAELQKQQQLLLSQLTLDDLKGYHLLVKKRAEEAKREYEAQTEVYEQKLAKAERDIRFAGLYNANMA